MPSSQELVRFLPFRSIAEPSFWLNHNSHKLNELRLSEEGVPLWGFFGPSGNNKNAAVGIPPGMRFDSSSSSDNNGDFEEGGAAVASRRNEWIRSHGKMYSLNTLESLKKLNKNAFLNEACLPSLLKCCGVDVKDSVNASGGNTTKSEVKEGVTLDPNVALVSCACITYCNLKTNMTVYWFGFPALAPRTGCGIAYSSSFSSGKKMPTQRRLLDAWGAKTCRNLSNSFHRFRVLQEGKMSMSGGENVNAVDDNDGTGSVWCPPFFLLLPISDINEEGNDMEKKTKTERFKCLPLSKATYDNLSELEKKRVIFGFADPNTGSQNANVNVGTTPEALGWTLRNLVAYLSLCLGLGGCDRTFLSYRSPFLRRITASEVETSAAAADNMADNNNDNDSMCSRMQESYEDVHVGNEDFGNDNGDAGIGNSLLLDIRIPQASDYIWPTATNKDKDNYSISSYRCVGWELNKNNKPGPRSIDLRPLVSPAHLSRQANDLNLRLMKWRALPSLDVEKLSGMKVLLLGAGTLGCGVARTLLGWGVRKITFVDSGRVSYSNPVRQSLFGIEDCKDGGRYKSVAAAESLVAVAGPDVKSEGVVLTIPMPGHSFGKGKDGAAETDAVQRDVARLHSLIEDNDVVFLLTDTRESRWLPTVMALASETPLVNAALGLDSWLVMRHGPPSSALSSINRDTHNNNDNGRSNNDNHQRLGCYFCSDVVAPENSTRDRTLDQQCTVTRPGLAPIAASMATELMVAMFHHPLGHCAPAPERKTNNNSGAYAPVDDGTDASSSALGKLPHQIRGTVVTYTMMTPTIPAFPSCTACATSVIEEYRKGGFDFVKSVCCDEDGSYLEKVSGLDHFREEAAKMAEECLDWDDDDDDV